MSLGIGDTITLGASLIFAIPLGVLGAQYAASGRTLFGGLLLAIAVLMVVLPQTLTTPGDVPAKVAEKVVGSAVKVPEDEDRRDE